MFPLFGFKIEITMHWNLDFENQSLLDSVAECSRKLWVTPKTKNAVSNS